MFFNTVRFVKIRLKVTSLLRGCFVYWVQNTNCFGQTQFVIWIYGRLLAWSKGRTGYVTNKRLILFVFPKILSYFHMFKKRVGLQMGILRFRNIFKHTTKIKGLNFDHDSWNLNWSLMLLDFSFLLFKHELLVTSCFFTLLSWGIPLPPLG